MKTKMKFKRVLAGLVCASALALSANAQAMTIEASAGATGSGTLADPFVVITPTAPGLFLHTINFDLGTDTHFNMTSTVSNLLSFGVPIFENGGDAEFVVGSDTHLAVPLPDLGIAPFDFHLHPQAFSGSVGPEGLIPGNGSYTLTMWGSTPAAVPIPAAVYLFGSGLIGLVGLARRKMRAAA